MDVASSRPFDVLIAYSPSRTAGFWWQDFRLDEARRDVERASSLQLRHLAIALTWSDFQPEMSRMAVGTMRSLERLLDAALERATRLQLILFPVGATSIPSLPDWALDPVVRGPRPVLASGHRSDRAVRNLYQDPTLIEAALRHVRELVGAFSQHPAVSGWVLGYGMGAASEPASPAAFEEWLGSMAEAARASGARQPLRHGLSMRDVILSRTLPCAVLGRLGLGPQVIDGWRPTWAGGSEQWLPFVAAYASSLARSPAVLTNLGPCTRSPGQSGPPGCVSEAAAAASAERLLGALHEVGGGGACAAALFDYSPALGRSPVLGDDPGNPNRGLVRPDGTPKEAAGIWAQFARSSPAVWPLPSGFPLPDRDLAARSPEQVARECFEAMSR